MKDIHENDRRDIQHIVDLLSGAGCFKIQQKGNSSLMQLKRKFTNYEDIRGAYDFKIIEIAKNEAIKVFADVVQRAGASSQHLLHLESVFTRLSEIANDNQEYYLNPSVFTKLLNPINKLLTALIEY
ncbi:unnamed protein product [Rotaria sp. Silwood1]|nr:unnamed protein product [Rotaria sp. Silwood1]CAF1688420.1 unnamed protein product [Rotaria sp. Silwood1]